MGSCIWTTEGDTAHQYESSDSIIAVRDSVNKVEESEDKSSVEAKHLSRDGNGTNSDNDGAGSLHACVFSTVRLWRTTRKTDGTDRLHLAPPSLELDRATGQDSLAFTLQVLVDRLG